MACLKLVNNGQSVELAMKAALALADYCQVSLALTEWPAREMCNNMTRNVTNSTLIEYYGRNCSNVCTFGKAVNGSCKCQHGYWGEDCSLVCPGGAVRPCNGHGVCAMNHGICDCDLNWRGDVNCTKCTPGYHGPDCLVSYQTGIQGRVFTSKIFAGIFIKTIDNVMVKLQRNGEFVAFKSDRINIEIQLRFVQRPDSVTLGCIALRIKERIVVLHVGMSGELVMTVDAKLVDIQSSLVLYGGYKYTRVSHNHFTISSIHGISVSVYNSSRSLSFDLNVQDSLCGRSTGLLGNCGQLSACESASKSCNVSNLSAFPQPNLTKSTLDDFMKNWEVKQSNSFFADTLKLIGVPVYPTRAQTCLLLNRTGMISAPLHNLFIGRYISIQLMLKVSSALEAGTVVSFAYNSTLSITINKTVQVHKGDFHIDSGLTIEQITWTQLTIVYHKITGVLQLFTKTNKRLAQSRVYRVGLGWFTDGLSMGIGLSQVSQVSSVSLIHPMFLGLIDDVRIWNIRLDSVTIEAHWQIDINKQENGLKAAWKMDEGAGTVAHDWIGSNDLKMPPSGWVLPKWMPADYELRSGRLPSVREIDQIKAVAESKCSKLIYDNALQEKCKNMLPNTTIVYFQACVEIVMTERKISAVDSVLFAYSSACMKMLNLTANPASHLCNNVSSKRIDNHFGVNCSQTCVYGEVTNDTCVCYKGYWGVNCTNECPGGAAKPCNNNGVCLQDTGKCICDYNWRGDANCSSCTVGWSLPLCKQATLPRMVSSTQTCMVTSTGSYVSFVGVQRHLDKPGKYAILNTTTTTYVSINAVPCLQEAVCIASIEIQSQMNVLSLQSNLPSSHAQFLVNQQIVDIEAAGYVNIHSGFAVVALSPSQHRINIKDLLSVDITSNSMYYDLVIKTHRPNCDSFKGLCGSCKQGSIWDPKFAKPAAGISEFTFGIYSLYFVKATLFSKELQIFSGDQLTIDFQVKSCDPSICGGPILAYAQRRTIYISNYITVKVYIEGSVYDTGIQTTTNQWNHVFISFSKMLKKVDVYIAYATQKLFYRSFVLEKFPFKNGGILSVGSWAPSMSGLDKQPARIFTGEIDELKIWDRFFDYPMVRQRVFSNINKPIPGLKAAWKMNEGSGLKTSDLVGNNDLYLPEYPMGKPLWRISSAPMTRPLIGVAFNDDTASKIAAERFCKDVILAGPIGSVCSGIEDRNKQYYFSICIQQVLRFQRNSASLNVIVEYSDYCQTILKLVDWPARPLCNLFADVKFPNWIGKNCSVNCVNGQRSYKDGNICVCDHGFWGTSCNNACDGGFSRPCSNHGICDLKTGHCICESNWMGDRNCSKCSKNTIGTDCSIAVTNFTASQSLHAFVSLRGYITLFGGYAFVLEQLGEYRLVYSAKLKVGIYGRFVVCYDRKPCLNAFVFRLSNIAVMIHAPYKESGNIVVWLNGQVIDIYEDQALLQSVGIKIIRKQPSKYIVSHHHGSVVITIIETFLTVSLKVDQELCEETFGLLGQCGKNISEFIHENKILVNCSKSEFPEYQPQSHSMNSSSIVNATYVELFARKFAIKSCESAFIYKHGEMIEHRNANSGYALKFNSTSLVMLNASIIANHVTTFDFIIRLERDGTILSYGRDTTFLLVTVELELQIWIGNDIYRTGIRLELNDWNQIVLQWEYSLSRFTIFVFDKRGEIKWKRISMQTSVDIFKTGGVFGIGQWQPALNNSYLKPNGSFVGVLEELRIWSRAFNPAVVWQLWSRSLRNDSHYLKVLISFDNIKDSNVLEEVSKLEISLVPKPWKKPVKEASSVVLKDQLVASSMEDIDVSAMENATAFCSGLLLYGPLHNHCASLGVGVAMFYHKQCVKIIIKEGDVHVGLQGIVSYADYCQTLLNLTSWPVKELCSRFQSRNMPKQMREYCNSDTCKFGLTVASGKCKCVNGYWGKTCDHVCPGGAWRPCNNKGKCDVHSGVCDCQVNWNSDAKCGKCGKGWVGTDCSVARVDRSLISRKVRTKALVLDGNILLMSGYVIGFNYVGSYWLLRDSVTNTYVQVVQIPCYVHKICVAAASMQFTSISLVIRAPLYYNTEPVIMVNNHIVKLTADWIVLDGGSFTVSMRFNARNEIVVHRAGSSFALIRIFERTLSVLLEENTSTCFDHGGILRACVDESTNMTSNFIAEELKRNWRATIAESASVFGTEYNVLSSAEFAVLIENTGAVSNPLCSTFESQGDYTIEFLFKPLSSQSIIISYALDTTIALYVDDTFKLSINTATFDSKIKIMNGSWHHVALMWWSVSSRLDFYVFDSNGFMQRRNFDIGSSPFFKCGIMSLGQWLASPRIPDGPQITSGRFYIDEIRVWNRIFDPLTVQQNYKMNVIEYHPELKALWKLNENGGDILQNLKNINESIYLPIRPWERPVRVLSDAEVNANLTDIFDAVITDSVKLESIQKHCRRLFYAGELWLQCKTLPSVAGYFYSLCVKDISLHNTSYAVYSVVTFADICQDMLNLTFWPAKTLCNQFIGVHFPRWIGQKCDDMCLFGGAKSINSSNCICDAGYWGLNCSAVCPGGALNPCSNHGKCEQATGKCICFVNWSGNDNCSACGKNWLGPSCDIVVEPIGLFNKTSFAIAFLTSTGQVTTWNGYSFYLKISQEIVVIHSRLHQFKVTIKFTPCTIKGVFFGQCLTFVTIRLNNLTIVLRAPYVIKNTVARIVPILFVNGKSIEIGHVTRISAETTMLRIYRNVYEIRISENFVLRIKIRQSLDVSLKVQRELCNNATGILGGCLLSRERYDELKNRLSLNHVVSSSQSIIEYTALKWFQEEAQVYGSLYNVYLNDTGMISTKFITLDVPVLTIELFVKTITHGGTLIAYLGNRLFAISNEVNMKIHFGSDVIKTDLSTDVGKSTIFLKVLWRLVVIH